MPVTLRSIMFAPSCMRACSAVLALERMDFPRRCAGARTASGRGGSSYSGVSCGPADGKEREMAPTSVEFDHEFQLCAGSAFDEHLGLRTWSGARPAGTRLEARVAAGGTAAEIDLVRRCAIQGRVGSFRVVPG